MKKSIKPSDWLLLGLAGLLDFLGDIKDPFDLFKNYYQDFYGYAPARWQKVNFYHLVWRNLKKGTLQKKEVKRNIYLQLTSLGKGGIKRKYPLLYLKNKGWDGRLRWAMYDIEEENKRVRELFRDKIKELGFGKFQKSVWVSPYDFLKEFRKFLKKYQLGDRVILLETDKFYAGNLKKLAKKVWQIDKLSFLYRELYKDLLYYKSLKKKCDRNRNLNNLRKRLKKKIIKVYFQDPFLPPEFLPEDWLGEKVKNLAKNLQIFQ